jgi:hypothetical protein
MLCAWCLTMSFACLRGARAATLARSVWACRFCLCFWHGVVCNDCQILLFCDVSVAPMVCGCSDTCLCLCESVRCLVSGSCSKCVQEPNLGHSCCGQVAAFDSSRVCASGVACMDRNCVSTCLVLASTLECYSPYNRAGTCSSPELLQHVQYTNNTSYRNFKPVLGSVSLTGCTFVVSSASSLTSLFKISYASVFWT